MKYPLLILTLLVTACSSVSGVKRQANGYFAVDVTSSGSSEEVWFNDQRKAYETARLHCAKSNEVVDASQAKLKRSQRVSSYSTSNNSKLRFKCKAGDEKLSSEHIPIFKAAPVYPALALKNGTVGHCIVLFGIDIEGNTENVSVDECTPEGVFDEASINAVERFRFYPQNLDGQPIASVGIKNIIRFELEDAVASKQKGPVSKEKRSRNNKRRISLRESVFRALQESQRLLVHEKNVEAALSVLGELEKKTLPEERNPLNDYETAMLWNYYSETYLQAGDYKNAKIAYENILKGSYLPEGLRLSTVAQLRLLSDLEDKGLVEQSN